MWIVLIILIILILHRRTALVVGPQKDKGTPQSAKTVSGKKRVVDSDDDEDEAAAGASLAFSSGILFCSEEAQDQQAWSGNPN